MSAVRHIALIGGGGFIGSHLATALLGRTDWAVHVVDTTVTKLTRGLASGAANGEQEATLGQRLRVTHAPITQPGLVETIVETSDVVVSLAALCNPSLYNTQPLAVIRSNYDDLLPLVARCTEHKRRLIHLSTCEVYGLSLTPVGAIAPVLREDETPLAFGPIDRERWTYACAKQLLERVIWASGRHHGLPFTIVRPFNVIGPRMDYLPGVDGEGIPRVLANFISCLLDKRPLPLVNGGTQRRSFLHVDDFIDAMLRIVARDEATTGEVLNIGNPQNDVTISQLARLMASIYSEQQREPLLDCVEVSGEAFYGAGYDDAPVRIPEIAKAQRLLQWAPTRRLEQMLPEIIEDYVRYYGGPDRSTS